MEGTCEQDLEKLLELAWQRENSMYKGVFEEQGGGCEAGEMREEGRRGLWDIRPHLVV